MFHEHLTLNVEHTVLDSSVATSSDASNVSLTTFLSSTVVASLFSESNSVNKS